MQLEIKMCKCKCFVVVIVSQENVFKKKSD